MTAMVASVGIQNRERWKEIGARLAIIREVTAAHSMRLLSHGMGGLLTYRGDEMGRRMKAYLMNTMTIKKAKIPKVTARNIPSDLFNDCAVD